MKSLSESLFDKDLISKDLTFGDMYEPEEILYSSTDNLKVIGNMFVGSKLKKDVKPLDLDGVLGYDQFKKLLDYLPYVLGKVAELPLEERFESAKYDGNCVSYEFKMDDMFREYIRRNSAKLSFTMSKWEWEPQLQIRKSTMQGLWGMTIKYRKK